MLDKIKTTKELAYYLGISENKLKSINPEDYFSTFYIQKPGSAEKRLIEYPKGELFPILKRLSDGLQWLYLDHITNAAYGFIRKIKPCSDSRDIFTNAKKHLGKKYLLKIDLEDFFHQIDNEKLINLFSDLKLFSLNSKAEQEIIKLVCYKGRLPMGSPTSPPISNFAAILMDNELLSWARKNNFVFTRFVDDMTFSSNMKITQTHLNQIVEILYSHRFVINQSKTRFLGPDDKKEVTGLILNKTINVPEEFLETFMNDIKSINDILHLAYQSPDNGFFEWLEKMKKILNGRLAFLKLVLGSNNKTYEVFKMEVDKLNNPVFVERSVSWRYAGYDYY